MYIDFISFWDVFFYFSFMKCERQLKPWGIRFSVYLIIEIIVCTLIGFNYGYLPAVLIGLNIWTYYTLSYCVLYSYYKNLWPNYTKPILKDKIKTVFRNYTKLENLNILFWCISALTISLSIITFEFILEKQIATLNPIIIIALQFVAFLIHGLATIPQAIYL